MSRRGAEQPSAATESVPLALPVLLVCPAKLANPVAASQRPSPVHGELNPTRKGVAGQRRGLKEAIGG